ncbi:MAG: Purine nucleoside phosphorylase DeoD-type [Chloroflexi bacterium ADurb.Bin325]|nr:MAG: Purine nucleoside phosphorylase DeoD-type [Chloroflexi bacterium ADurb.Bin325]
MKQAYPILEFDPAPRGIIEPRRPAELAPVPEACVVCFFGEVIRKLAREKRLRRIHSLRSEMGPHPVYELVVDGRPRVTVFPSAVGAALAAGLVDELIACGARRFVACGGAGVLDREIAVGHVVIPVSAVRDEGTSYHYLAPGREVTPDPAAVAAIEQVLQAHGVPYVKGKTWTTDGFYRETPDKVALRRAEGCLTVEMEAAAFFAVAQFRGVQFGQMLYGGDDVSGAEWDHRDWHRRTTLRERLFWLAVEAAIACGDAAGGRPRQPAEGA